ncbi:MAG: CAP domain-containing protein [Phycisphaerae bacterium]|nr:CAP domain-containing protein [Phycisphaerae bacterium]
MRRLGLFLTLCVLASLLPAGCPQGAALDGPRIPGADDDSGVSVPAGGNSGAGGSTGSGLLTEVGTNNTPASESDRNGGLTSFDEHPAGSLSDSLSLSFPGCDEPLEAAYWRSEVLRLVNVERAYQGLDSVMYNATLEQQAEQYACELIHYQFFDHVNPVTGSTLDERADEFGYEYWSIGENLAAGQPSPVEAVQDWMDSPEHRENVLNPAFTELGVAVRVGGEYQIYWVQEFGRPYSAAPYPDTE